MRIASSQILLSAQHALTEKHTRQESLVAGVSSTGAWNAAARENGAMRATERTQDLPGPSAPSQPEPPSLLDEYLGGRSLESVEREAAALQDGEAGAGRRPAAAVGEGAESDLARLADFLLRQPRAAGLQDLAGTGPDGSPQSTDQVAGAAAAGIRLPDLEVLRQGLAGLTSAESGDLLSRLFEVYLPLPSEGYAALEVETDPQDRLKIDLIRAAVAAFTGRQLRILEPGDLDLSGPSGTYPAARGEVPPEGETPSAGPALGVSYSRRETHYERETTTFEAQGKVQTTDGQEIDVDVSLTMGRQFYSEESVEVRAGAALQDPLVVNFAGTAAELSERTFAFDLDTDGDAEQIHFVGPNSGFLALDRNGNGAVDDGAELFGPATGQGFAELANYDEDGNRFIDEADSVYEGLRIWQKDAGGNDRLLALGQAGVGAIYLGHTDTPFQVKDDQNQLQGVVRSSGIYLEEDGGTGTVQQLDLVV